MAKNVWWYIFNGFSKLALLKKTWKYTITVFCLFDLLKFSLHQIQFDFQQLRSGSNSTVSHLDLQFADSFIYIPYNLLVSFMSPHQMTKDFIAALILISRFLKPFSQIAWVCRAFTAECLWYICVFCLSIFCLILQTSLTAHSKTKYNSRDASWVNIPCFKDFQLFYLKHEG